MNLVGVEYWRARNGTRCGKSAVCKSSQTLREVKRVVIAVDIVSAGQREVGFPQSGRERGGIGLIFSVVPPIARYRILLQITKAGKYVNLRRTARFAILI